MQQCQLSCEAQTKIKHYQQEANQIITDIKQSLSSEPTFVGGLSPNLNLIERLWKFMKGKILYNKYYEKFDIFKETTLGFFENIDQYKDELDSLLTNNFYLLDAK